MTHDGGYDFRKPEAHVYSAPYYYIIQEGIVD